MSFSWGRRSGTIVLVVMMLACMALPTRAGRWEFRKSLDIQTYGSSNLYLTETDQTRSTALSVRPGIYATRRGGRADARVAYAPALLFYLDDSSSDRVAHYLNARVNAEIIDNLFFLRANARAGQVLNDPLNKTGFDAVSNPDAVSNTYSFSITPDFSGPLLRAGRYARFRIQPGFNYSFTQDGLDSAVGRSTRVNVYSGPAFSRTPWSLNYQDDIFNQDSQDGYGRLDATFGVLLNDDWRLDQTLGYDKGRYDSSSDTSGFRWRTTATWAPNPRSNISFGIGEAFYGEDWVLDIRHRHKHSAWFLSYDRSIDNARGEILQTEFIPLEDLFGEPILDPVSGLPLLLVVGTPAQIEDVYLLDRLEARWSWLRGRTNAHLRLQINRRDYQSLELDETDQVASLGLSRRITQKTSASVDMRYWDHSEEQTQSDDFAQYALTMHLSHQLSRHLRLGLGYTYTERSSDTPGGSFEDNLINFDLGFHFNR